MTARQRRAIPPHPRNSSNLVSKGIVPNSSNFRRTRHFGRLDRIAVRLVIIEQSPLELIFEKLQYTRYVILIDVRNVHVIELLACLSELAQFDAHVLFHAGPHTAIAQNMLTVRSFQQKTVTFG